VPRCVGQWYLGSNPVASGAGPLFGRPLGQGRESGGLATTRQNVSYVNFGRFLARLGFTAAL